MAAQYEVVPAERFFPVLRATEKLWPKLRPQLTCPLATCAHPAVVCHDNTEARVWRHLDAFGKRTGLLCSPPRARYGTCRHVWRASDPCEGEGKQFTRDFAAFALTLMLEMTMKKVGDILGQSDTRLSGVRFSGMWPRRTPRRTCPVWCTRASMR